MTMPCLLRAVSAALALAALTAAAAAQQCPNRYAALDLNGDGVVDAEENAAFNDSLFGGLDADANGYISPEEYRVCFGVADQQPAEAAPGAMGGIAFAELPGGPLGRVGRAEYFAFGEARYRALPRDESGRVGTAAYAAGMAGLSVDPGQADRDEDGSVGADEAAADLDRSFDRLDADRDRTISEAEWAGGPPEPTIDPAVVETGYLAYNPADPRGISRQEFMTLSTGAVDPAAAPSPWSVRLRSRGY